MSYEQLEANVLGSLMVNRSAWDRGGHLLKPTDFTCIENQNIFRAIRFLVSEGATPDTVAVAEVLQRDGKLNDGGQYVSGISNQTVSPANIEAHAKMLLDVTVQRSIHGAALQIQSLKGSGREQLIQVQRIITDLEQHDPREPIPLSDCTGEWMKQLAERSEAGNGVIGRKFGFQDVDNRMGGMRPGDLIVVAGRPSMGKTALAMSSILTNCVDNQSCLMFSLEMDRGPLMDRIIANMACVPMGSVRTPTFLNDSEWPKITAAVNAAEGLPWYLDDEPSLTIQEIHSRARRIKRKHGLGLLVVDYIQLVETDRRYSSRRDHVAEVSRTLKKIAKDLQVPVIALSQLNRECEKRPNKRPQMSDLYESGSVEQDADAIGFVYRDVVYNEGSAMDDVCELIWAKVRNGEPGTDYLHFHGSTQRFTQASRERFAPLRGLGVGSPKVDGPYSDKSAKNNYKRSHHDPRYSQ